MQFFSWSLGTYSKNAFPLIKINTFFVKEVRTFDCVELRTWRSAPKNISISPPTDEHEIYLYQICNFS